MKNGPLSRYSQHKPNVLSQAIEDLRFRANHLSACANWPCGANSVATTLARLLRRMVAVVAAREGWALAIFMVT